MTAHSETEIESWTIRKVLTWTQQRFAAQRLGSPRLDAELLLGFSLGWARIALYTNYEKVLEAAELERFRGLIKRRLSGEPVAYLVGQKEFYSLALQVTDAVLIPRPETELLVDQALALLPLPNSRAESAPVAVAAAAGEADGDATDQQVPAERGVALTVHYESIEPAELPEESDESDPADPQAAATSQAAPSTPIAAAPPSAKPSVSDPSSPTAVIADIGTGSGAVALAIKANRPAVRVLAIDRSDDALRVAAKNADRLGLTVEFLHGDLLAPLPPPLRLDLITANLPYIPSAEIATLAPEVRNEPHEALDGGRDGLDLVRRLITAAPQHLRRGGALLLEIGAGQHLAVEALLRAAGFVDVQSHQDLAAIPRVVIGHLR